VHAKGNNRIATAKSGAMPVLIELASTAEVRDAVVRDVQRLVRTRAALSEIVVLARTKAQLYEIEAALLAAEIDTNRLGKVRQHLHVSNVLRLVRVVERHASKAQGAKQRMDGTVVKSALAKAAEKAGIQPPETYCKQAIAEVRIASRSSSLAGRYQGCVRAYLKLLGGSRQNKEIQHDIARWEQLCGEHDSSAAMREALKAVPAEKVVTATIHAAKGREWKHVRVVGVTEGLLPIYHAKDEEAIREEMRLMYVAITRAIDTLKLYHAPTPHTRSGKTFDKLSRFVASTNVSKQLNHPTVAT
jgi:DNA helicase II / ATP-dependent DNA helicase PcrA